MVWLHPVGVFVLFVGISQAEYCYPLESCAPADMPDDFPATAEEFDQFCKVAVPFVECLLKEAGECDPEPRATRLIERISPVLLRMCNNDSLLNKGIKESIECFDTNMAEIRQCYSVASFTEFEETLEVYLDALSENGVTLTDEEFESRCPYFLYTTSCGAATSGKVCGDVAKDVLIELSLSLDVLDECNAETAEKINIAVDVMETHIAGGEAFKGLLVQE